MVKAGTRELKISKKANNFIMSLPQQQRKAIKTAIEKLLRNEIEGLDIKRLFPHPSEYRLRVGKVRVLFKSTKEQLFMFKAGYRGDVYKG